MASFIKKSRSEDYDFWVGESFLSGGHVSQLRRLLLAYFRKK